MIEIITQFFVYTDKGYELTVEQYKDDELNVVLWRVRCGEHIISTGPNRPTKRDLKRYCDMVDENDGFGTEIVVAEEPVEETTEPVEEVSEEAESEIYVEPELPVDPELPIEPETESE